MPVRHVLMIHVECVIHRRRRWGIVWRSRLFEKEWVEVLVEIRQRLCGVTKTNVLKRTNECSDF